MAWLLILAVSGLLNRLRGTSYWKDWLGLPGRSLWWTSPAFGLVVLLGGLSVWQGAALAGLLILWATPGWGRWFGLGRAPLPDRPASWWEKHVETVASGRIHLAFLVRQLWLVPGVLGMALFWPMALWGLALPVLILAVYEGSWQVYDRYKNDYTIPMAEVLTGLLFGGYAWLLVQ